MWNIFKYKSSNHLQSRESYEDTEKRYRELKHLFEKDLQLLTKNIATSQHFFKNSYLVNAKQQSLTQTFEEMMATLQGLIAIIDQLKIQYDQIQEHAKQYKQVKHVINNHHSIINSIQQSHSTQVTHIYEEKRKSQELLNQSIRELTQQNAMFQQKIRKLQLEIEQQKQENLLMREANNKFEAQNKDILRQLYQLQLKYNILANQGKKVQNKKIINFQHIKLQYIFYYGKLRDRMVAYLSIKDLFNLEKVNKFFRASLRKEESRHIYQSLRRREKKLVENQAKTAKFYEKIYESFPIQNIKICAFKYLYFKIKPAAYILPFLQEENQFQLAKSQQQSKNTKQQTNKFNWKHFFSSDKANKGEKKEENKFSLSQFKNEEDYKKVQAGIENLFKNIFPLKMPEDFRYFTQTMQRQLQQLKEVIGPYKNSKGVFEWTAQLHCLTKYMYLQINQLFNLLQVIFGDLLRTSKDLIAITQNYDYLRQNETVLRNLIQNVSNDKSNIERKYVMMQNQILKKKLQNEAICNKYQQLLHEHQQYKAKHHQTQSQYADTLKLLQKYQEERRLTEHNMIKIREQLENLERNPGKQRRLSIGSLNSEENGIINESSGF